MPQNDAIYNEDDGDYVHLLHPVQVLKNQLRLIHGSVTLDNIRTWFLRGQLIWGATCTRVYKVLLYQTGHTTANTGVTKSSPQSRPSFKEISMQQAVVGCRVLQIWTVHSQQELCLKHFPFTNNCTFNTSFLTKIQWLFTSRSVTITRAPLPHPPLTIKKHKDLGFHVVLLPAQLIDWLSRV